MATTTQYYKIFDGGYITIKNIKTIVGTGKDAYVREEVVRGRDEKIETPDAGRITKFGPVEKDTNGEFIKIPAAMAAVRLPLYRAGAGTAVIIPAGDAEQTGIIITPTLSEEVVYYKAACEALELDFTYDDGQ